MEAGDSIYINVETVNTSDSTTVDYHIWETDDWGREDSSGTVSRDEYGQITINNNHGYDIWYAEWSDDGIWGEPEYEFAVKFSTETNYGDDSDEIFVRDTTPPEVPELISPANDTTFSYDHTMINFDWNDSDDNNGYGSGVDNYHIQVSRNSGSTDIVW